MRATFLLLALAAGACREQGSAPAPPTPTAPAAQKSKPMNGTLSPSGDRHPGEIAFDDKVGKRQWTKQAAEVPPTTAWTRSQGRWIPVVRIQITGIPGRREITKFGPGNEFLETSVQMPRPR